jgi:hypothetical protein
MGWNKNRVEMSSNKCECGCGEHTKYYPDGYRIRKYVDGHYRGFWVGKKRSSEDRKKFSESHIGLQSQENHYAWMGEFPSYMAVHLWLRKNFIKPSKCEMCKKDGLSGRKIHWANISGKYKRDRKDYKALCPVCHRVFDGLTKLSQEDAKLIRIRVAGGETMRKVSADYGVDRKTVSNLVNGKVKYHAK